MRNGIERTAMIAAMANAVAACSALPEPGYDPPDEDAAIIAFKAANTIDADILRGLELGETSELPIAYELIAPEWAAGWNTFQRAGTISALLNSNRAYDKVIPSNCEWQFVDPEKVRKVSQPRVAGEAFPAWFCDVEVLLTQQHNIKAKGIAQGYFYQTEDGWMYVGESTSDIVRDHDRMEQRSPSGVFRHESKGESNWGS